MLFEEAIEIVLGMAERWREGEGSELCGTKEREAIELLETLKEDF